MNKFFNLKNKTILLTGPTGFIGSNILKHLINEKCKLILIVKSRAS